jgi:hypothetical protein
VDRPATTRGLDERDGLLLRLATWLNLNWSGPRLTVAQLGRRSAPRRPLPVGAPEFGVVATADGEPTGVVGDPLPGRGPELRDVVR